MAVSPGAPSAAADPSHAATPFHRFDLARALAEGVVAALGAGNVRGARVALDGLRALVDAAEHGEASAAPAEGARVVPLDERRRRDR